jgi:ElaB/YqjD/DUF883 family membrane-anchored ribosome-binding protein
MADGIILFRPDHVLSDEDAPDSREIAEGSGGDAEIQRLEAEIAVKRERVVASLGELRRRMDVATDWRGWVRAHPTACIAGALAVGFMLGSLGSGGRRYSR